MNKLKRFQLIGLSLLSGFIFSLSWPERGFAPLIFVAFVPLLLMQEIIANQSDTRKKPSVFRIAFAGFFVWNLLTTYWIYNSTFLGVAVAVLLNTSLMSAAFWLYHLSRTKIYKNNTGTFLLIFYWMSYEYLVLNWDLNWPWLNLGHVFATQHTWIQWYEFTGVQGGSLWVLLMNLLAFKIVKILHTQYIFKQLAMPIIGFVLLLLVPVSISKSLYNHQIERGEETEIVVVQPNFDPYTEQYDLSPSVIIQRNLDLASTAITPQTAFVLSPESAIQEAIWEERLQASPGLKMVETFVKKNPQLSTVIGASTFSHVPKGQETDFAARKFMGSENYYYAYNTAFFVDSSGVKGTYHKSKLTPGVEMMPSWFFLKPLRNFAINLGGTIGTLKMDEERKVFRTKNVAAAPLICYESVYGEFVTGFVKNGANLLFVITNDGWWGNTPGHRQHFLFSVLRAIETRRSVARSANTGISAFVNQRGDVFHRTPYWEQAVIRQKLHTNDSITFYVKYGDYFYRVALVFSVLSLILTFILFVLNRKKVVS